ncbi:MAG TPA: NAD(P)/FAD-dependent oxidoreductase [Terriglobia bacterium]|nr:NAD(P)/FAD-dependent oxidoreductase [Terriglobia bacterium]
MKDVIIVGGGPAGLHAAYQLASAGLDVSLFDSQKQIGERAVCSGVISIEAFSRFGLPTAPVLNSIRAVQAVSPAGHKIEHSGTVPLAHVVNKAEFNRELATRAAAAGAELCLGRFVEAVEQKKHGVTLQYHDKENREPQIAKARAVIIASGVNRSLTAKLGLVRPRDFLRAIQADIPLGRDGAARPTKIYVGQSVAPGAFGWKIPLGHGRVRVGLMTSGEPRPYFKKLLGRMAPRLRPDQYRISQKAIAQWPQGRCVTDRVMVIGEAAGHVKTTTGGGIYYGLISAEMAADVMARACRANNFSEQTLSAFENYARSTFNRELETGYFFRKMVAKLPDSLLNKTFAKAGAIDLFGRLRGNLIFDWHYKAILIAIRQLFNS